MSEWSSGCIVVSTVADTQPNQGRDMDTVKKSISYNQSGSRERCVEMLATAVARLVNRCSCMSPEMRVRFMARLLDNLAEPAPMDDEKLPTHFSLEAVMKSAPENPETAVSEAATLLTRSLRREQGLNRESLFRFYDALFELLIPREMNPRAA